MYPRTPLPPDLQRLAQQQAGVISSAQASGCGLSRQAFRRFAKDWRKVSNGIYITGDVSWDAMAWASLLRGGHSAVIGSGAACHLHGLIFRQPEQFTVWATSARPPLIVDEFRTDFRQGFRRGRGQLSRTSVEDAILDFAGEADSHDLIEAVTRAFTKQRSTPSRLLAEMGSRSRVAQRKLLNELCLPTNQGIQSVLEWLFDKLVIVPHRLNSLQRQVKLTRQHRVDIWFEGQAVIVELDGRGFHDAESDARRDNEHALWVGATTLRFTWRQVLYEPCEVARIIAQALRMRGWQGDMGRCSSCYRMP